MADAVHDGIEAGDEQHHGVVLHVVHRRRLTVDLGLPQHRDDVVLRIDAAVFKRVLDRSEEHTPELQSLMRISYAVFCLKKKKKKQKTITKTMITCTITTD